MARSLAEFRAITFDCYGTLIDWEAGILRVLRPWAQAQGIDRDDDGLLAAFAIAEPAEEHAHPGAPYRDILRGVMPRVADELGAACSPGDAEALALSVGDWPAFDDTPAALRVLAEHCRLIVVSNVDAPSFEGSATKLGVSLDGLVTAEHVGAYKPDVRMFRAALEAVAACGVQPREHLHVAQSLYHDIVPASALGIATCWIDRRAGQSGGATPEPGQPVRPDFMFTTMEEFAGAMTAAHTPPPPPTEEEETADA